MSYVAAAQGVARHIPHEQLQVIFVNHLGQHINGIAPDVSRRQAGFVREVLRNILERYDPESATKIMFAEDTPQELVSKIEPDINDLIQGDEDIRKKLSSKGEKHGSNFASYAAAHVVHHETAVLVPQEFTTCEPAAIKPERIVSIGCQQEHVFYNLRAKARESLTYLPYIPTAQIFTKHVLPPYYMALRGEQSIEHALSSGVDLSQMTDLSAERDVQHLLSVLPRDEIKL